MPTFGPIKRRELLRCLRSLGFEGPFSGGKHQFMVRGDVTVRVPNPHQGDIGKELSEKATSGERAFGAKWLGLGARFVSSHKDGTIRIWEDFSEMEVLEGHTDIVPVISVSHDGQIIATKSNDESVRLWASDSLKTVALLREESAKHADYLDGLAFAPHVTALATVSGGTILRIWDIDTDLEIHD